MHDPNKEVHSVTFISDILNEPNKLVESGHTFAFISEHKTVLALDVLHNPVLDA